LTEKAFSMRLKDLLAVRPDPETRELELLKLGRHFRIGPEARLVVGRNKGENEAMRALCRDGDILLSCRGVPGPTAVLLGEASEDTLERAAAVTAAYSDTAHLSSCPVEIRQGGRVNVVEAGVRDKAEFRDRML
jgi:predicted ribosome quality control (RQC) complex YloA/Tae2 family protein